MNDLTKRIVILNRSMLILNVFWTRKQWLKIQLKSNKHFLAFFLRIIKHAFSACLLGKIKSRLATASQDWDPVQS